MFFCTRPQCQEEANAYGFDVDPARNQIVPRSPFPYTLTLGFSDAIDRSYAVAQRLAAWCQPFERLVLWVTEWGIWPSSENLYLYYTVRRAHGDARELHEAPGHIFLKHEQAELTTFLDLAIRFGWGGFLFGHPPHVAMTVSHDEWITIASDQPLAPIARDADDFGLKVLDQGDGGVL